MAKKMSPVGSTSTKSDPYSHAGAAKAPSPASKNIWTTKPRISPPSTACFYPNKSTYSPKTLNSARSLSSRSAPTKPSILRFSTCRTARFRRYDKKSRAKFPVGAASSRLLIRRKRLEAASTPSQGLTSPLHLSAIAGDAY